MQINGIMQKEGSWTAECWINVPYMSDREGSLNWEFPSWRSAPLSPVQMGSYVCQVSRREELHIKTRVEEMNLLLVWIKYLLTRALCCVFIVLMGLLHGEQCFGDGRHSLPQCMIVQLVLKVLFNWAVQITDQDVFKCVCPPTWAGH